MMTQRSENQGPKRGCMQRWDDCSGTGEQSGDMGAQSAGGAELPIHSTRPCQKRGRISPVPLVMQPPSQPTPFASPTNISKKRSTHTVAGLFEQCTAVTLPFFSNSNSQHARPKQHDVPCCTAAGLLLGSPRQGMPAPRGAPCAASRHARSCPRGRPQARRSAGGSSRCGAAGWRG